jgi:UDP-N-acetylmuramoyl-L-alanyl-D-glutamate--2,6-diaminopimelate ligase
MGEVAGRLADYTIVTSDNPRTERPEDIIEEIVEGFQGGESHTVIVDRGDAIREALQISKKGDVLLIAGKGHENFQEFAKTTVSFDDRVVVKRALENA